MKSIYFLLINVENVHRSRKVLNSLVFRAVKSEKRRLMFKMTKRIDPTREGIIKSSAGNSVLMQLKYSSFLNNFILFIFPHSRL